MADRGKFRGGTTSAAEAADDTLEYRELGITIDGTGSSREVKGFVGDGTSTFTDLEADEDRGIWVTPQEHDSSLSGYVPTTRTVNGHALSADVTVSKSDVGLSNVTNDAQLKAADLDNDTTLAADSSTKVPSQHAVKTFVSAAVAGLLELKGVIDCSANPNYPAASKGDAYFASVAGKIGGASGKTVDVGDMILALADNAGGDEATVGTSWGVLEHNLVGALLSSNNLSDVGSASTARTNLGLGSSATHADTDFAQVANNLSDLANAGTARTNLGLGTSATHAAGDFAQTANNLSDLANASTARTNLGVAIGTNVQAWDADLDALAVLTPTTDSFIQAKSSSWAARTVAQVKTDLGISNVDNTSDATKNAAAVALTNKDLTSGTNTFPTFNQATTAKSGSTDALNSATTTVNVSAATAPTSGQVLTATDSTHATWQTSSAGGSGTVTDVSVVSANGFAGSVATSTTTPAITLSTSVTGLLKGNGTAISAASAGTDYQAAMFVTVLNTQATVSNTTTETTLWTASTLAAANLSAGVTTLNFRLGGTIDNVGTSGLLTLRIKAGSSTIATIQLISTSQSGGATLTPWSVDGSIMVDSTGASAGITVWGNAVCLTTAGGGQNPRPYATTTAAVNLSTSLALTVTGQWATANASNVLRLTRAVAHQVN